MKAEFQATSPDTIEMTLTITMRLREWRDLKAQLTKEYPSWKFAAVLREIITFGEEHFMSKEEADL